MYVWVCFSIGKRYLDVDTLFENFFCNFPLHHVVEQVSLNECIVDCMSTPGCQSFNFKGSKFEGTCVIVAPTGSNAVVEDSNSEGWTYYGWNYD